MIACKGEIVTCVSGHGLYRLTQDILALMPFNAEQFERIDERAQELRPQEQVRDCPICGQPWVSFFAGVHVHFRDGWRPRLDS